MTNSILNFLSAAIPRLEQQAFYISSCIQTKTNKKKDRVDSKTRNHKLYAKHVALNYSQPFDGAYCCCICLTSIY